MILLLTIPKTFSLAGMDFTVKIVDNVKDGADYGEYSDVENTIYIAKRIKEDNIWKNISEKIMFNTFLHELFHVFQYYYNNRYDESQAQVYANFTMELLQTYT